MSVITNFLGLNPSAPTPQKRKNDRSLGRLSLSRLTGIGQRAEKLKKGAKRRIGEIIPEVETEQGRGPLFGGAARVELGQERTKLREARSKIKKTSAARKSLIQRGVASRTGRATQISTLLGRGI